MPINKKHLSNGNSTFAMAVYITYITITYYTYAYNNININM